MPVKIVGDYPQTERVSTGIFSIDRALGDPIKERWGMPLRSMYEIYGYPHTGKSTLSYYLAGRVDGKNDILLADLEGLDRDYLVAAVGASGFDGTVRIIPYKDTKNKNRSHEEIITDMVDGVFEETVSSGILDSIGAIQPMAEVVGDVGEAFIGKRAKAVAQLSRRAVAALKLGEKPSAIFIINHLHPMIGGRFNYTPGGQTLEYLSGVRIRIQIKERITSSEGELLGILSKGFVDKLRFGGPGRTFQFVIIPGQGINPGLSAMFDCIELGLAERKSTIKIGKKSFGYISKLMEAGRAGDSDAFAPFYEQLEKEK